MGVNSIGYDGKKLNIGFSKPKIEGVLSLGEVSKDIGWDNPVYGFCLKFRW